MNKKQIFHLGLSAVLIFMLAFGLASCKKDDSPSGPGGGGIVSIGSGTVSAPVTGTVTTTLNFSGSGKWPPAGTGVGGALSASGNQLQFLGYQELTTKLSQSTGVHFNFVAIEVNDPSGISVKTYTDAHVQVGINIDTTNTDSTAFISDTATVVVTTKTSTEVSGTFSGTFTRASDGATITVTGGTFTVNNYITGTIFGTGNSGGGVGSGSFIIDGAGYTNATATLGDVLGGLYTGGTGPETSIGGAGTVGADSVHLEIYFPGAPGTGKQVWSDSSGISVQITQGSTMKFYISLDGQGSTNITAYGAVGGDIVGTISGKLFGLVASDTLTVSGGVFTAHRFQ